MNLLSIAWKSLRQRRLASFLTALSVALGVALMISVLVINGIVTRMFTQSGTGYQLIIGPKGSDLQLVLSTVYRIDRPIENLPAQGNQLADVIAARQLRHHPAVAGMQRHLAVQRIGQQTRFGVVQGDPGFVAGGFYAQNQHGAHLTLPRGFANPLNCQ